MKFTYASGARPIQGYTIRRGLGRGGFGEVYLGISDGGKEVALKLVQQHLDVELRGVGQCLNLKHPNLVIVHDILKAEDGDAWIVMEYVAGESLEQLLARHPQGIPEPQALGWLHGICSGVRYLHEHGIVHRDLKPGNLFSENGVVKIGDYGLSKFISSSRRSGQTVSIGSVHYMAPEISHGRYGHEVDQYALGIILCQMLTGRVPFDGESHGEILMKHLTAEPELGRLSEPYRSVVARLLAKDPRNRYAAVQDLLDELPALDPGMLGAFPGPEQANPSSDAEAGVQAEQPGAEQPRPGGARKLRFAKRPLIRFLAEKKTQRSCPGHGQDDVINGNVDKEDLILKGVCRDFIIKGKVDGQSHIDLSGLTIEGSLIIEDKFDGQSQLTGFRTGRDFRIGKKVDGQSVISGSCGGNVSIGEKIDGSSQIIMNVGGSWGSGQISKNSNVIINGQRRR
jgi:serine/threonine protein kinase